MLYNKKLYEKHDALKIYLNCIENKLQIPSIIKNKNDYLLIIKYAYDNNWFDNSEELDVITISRKCRLHIYEAELTLKDIYLYLFGIELEDKIINTSEKAKEIFFSYLKDNNIKIKDVYTFNYSDIIKNAYLRGYIKRKCNNSILDFLMELYDYKYAPYKFKGGYETYWKEKDNVNFALKYYIEYDQNIPLEKIPLYVTLNNLQKNARTLYTIIYNKKFHKTLFEWVNDVYPNKFIENDFNIGNNRNYFDSNEEEIIYNYLKNVFKNVIYNKRNCENTIIFKGIIPDYIIFTDNACYLIEYFGLYVPERVNNSKRISDYVKRTDKKINKYKTISYNKIFIYPNDLLDEMKGLQEKIKNII